MTYKTIRKATKKLLESGESEFVDYKESYSGIKSDDLVAFANSATGGSLLIGIKEDKGNVQKGIVVGCKVDDKTRMAILSKAIQCHPPISITIDIENSNEIPFLHIKIPSGDSKPYCTSGGTYKIRKDGQNAVLLPEEILNIFLEKEAGKFNSRFSKATDSLLSELSNIESVISTIERSIEGSINNIASKLDWTEYSASNTESTTDSIFSYVKKMNKDLNDIVNGNLGNDKRLKVIVDHLELKDPVRADYINEVHTNIIEQFKTDVELWKRASNDLNGLMFEEKSKWNLTESEKKKILKSAYEYVLKEEE